MVAIDLGTSLQSERLRDVLGRLATAPSPYWQAKLRGVDIAAVRGVEDIAALPFTTKRELRDAYPYGALAVPRERVVRVHASSGTSGKPTIVAYTRRDVELFAEVNARAIAMAGGGPGDVFQVTFGYGLFTGGLGLHYGAERLGATVVPASAGNTGLQVKLLADLGVSGMAGTPSFGLALAERAAADGLLERISLRYGLFGAEPWSEELRRRLEAAWGGLDARDLYGLSEVIGPGVAAECAEKSGLHVFDDHFYPEVVDPASGQPLEVGEVGELVLTTLTKEATPLVRYRTGDVTRLVPGDCPCGRTHRRIARISGRVDDMLVVRGVNVYPSAVEAVLLADPAFASHYALVVDRRGTLSALEVHVELASEQLRDAVERLTAGLEEHLRLRVQVVVAAPGALPRSEVGKVKRVFQRTAEADELVEYLAARR